MNLKLLILTSGFVLSSCSSTEVSNYNSETDVFIKDIPDENLKLIKDKTESLLNLESIENGYDDFQIRIWLGNSFNDTSHLFIFRNHNDNWEGEYFEMIYLYLPKTYDSILKVYHPTFPELKEIEKKSKVIIPLSGWKKFIKKLIETGIYDLPHYKEIPDYYLPADANGITFEITSQKKYRLFHYPSPDLYAAKLPEAGKVVQIIKLLEKEFEFERLHK